MSIDSADTSVLAAAMKTLIDSQVPIGLAVLDRNLRYVQINEVLAAANGPSVAEHLGRTIREVLPGAADVIEPLARKVMGGEPITQVRIEIEVPSLPGELSEWEIAYLPINGPDGESLGMLAHAENLTMQRKHERLQRETEQLRRLRDCSFVYIGILKPEGVVLEINKAPLDAAGIGLDDVQTLPIWETHWWSHDPAKQAWLRDAVPRVAAGELVVRGDVEVRMEAGQLRMVDYMLAPMRDETTRVIHLVASAIDISNRVAAQRALRDSEDRYRRMFEGSIMGKALVDHRGQVLLANDSLAQMFGYATG